MKLKHKKERKLQKGITLIALVITIIVLLILAGVSIATLTGDNGILTKAQTAKTKTEKASEEEQIQLAALNAAMNTKKYDYEVEDGKVPIPAGFAPTQIEGQNSIKDGVVVVDENGNEFVWIPCDIVDNNETDEIVNGNINYNAKRPEAWRTYQSYYNGGTWSDGQPNKTEIQDSIKTNKGFYIARYEAGVPKNADFYASKEGDIYYTKTLEGSDTVILKNTDKYIPVSKKGVQAWSYITQINAKKVAGNMIKNNDVQSYLIDSHAWDTTCRVIKKYTNKDITNSTQWGNYYNNTTTKYEDLNTLYAVHTNNGKSWEHYAETYHKGQVIGAPKGKGDNRLELSTGASEDFKAYNIYDFAGNMAEWTTEYGTAASTDNSEAPIPEVEKEFFSWAPNAVVRGSSFAGGGIIMPVVVAGGNATANGWDISLGFRVVLYLE